MVKNAFPSSRQTSFWGSLINSKHSLKNISKHTMPAKPIRRRRRPGKAKQRTRRRRQVSKGNNHAWQQLNQALQQGQGFVFYNPTRPRRRR